MVRDPGICRKYGVWKTRGVVENTGSKWKTRGLVENAGSKFKTRGLSGKRGLWWKKRGLVENAGYPILFFAKKIIFFTKMRSRYFVSLNCNENQFSISA